MQATSINDCDSVLMKGNNYVSIISIFSSSKQLFWPSNQLPKVPIHWIINFGPWIFPFLCQPLAYNRCISLHIFTSRNVSSISLLILSKILFTFSHIILVVALRESFCVGEEFYILGRELF